MNSRIYIIKIHNADLTLDVAMFSHPISLGVRAETLNGFFAYYFLWQLRIYYRVHHRLYLSTFQKAYLREYIFYVAQQLNLSQVIFLLQTE